MLTPWLVRGFVATVILTTLLTAAQRLGLTRMSLPYLLGTMFTPDRDRARLVGTMLHLANGWALALVYFAVFAVWGQAGALRGALLGVGHAAIVAGILMPLMPSIHPRMASEQEGPFSTRLLEPPGFFGLHYGPQTPLWMLLAHVAYGAFLGLAAKG
jgi:hypothetical protein